MTTPQFYFLLLACGAFLMLALGLAASTLRYHAWRRRAGARDTRPH